MKLAIIGAGKVGGTLGRGLARAGHTIHYGARDPRDAKHAALRDHAQVGTPREAVETSDAVVLATPWPATEAAIAALGDLDGRVLVDATNPIGPGFVLTHGHTDSGGEQVARWARTARVVKAFNTTGVETMAAPRHGDARAAMFVAGDDAAACEVALGLARDLGFEAVRLGGLVRARVLEPTAMLWIQLAMVRGLGRDIAFGVLRRGGGQ
ncbi:MAG: NAD(P)-binding domain-containing protein [Deltaproteobacteria bacterium]|nr:NAD(P)-binding domain-containing protein [Deltaproteobacteria bacterium]